jgi:hypothetical protein
MSIALFSFSVLLSAFLTGHFIAAHRRAALSAQAVPVNRK